MPLELLTIDEVAILLRVSRDVVYRLANDGDLVGRKIGRAWRFPRQAVEEYVWSRSTQSQSSTQTVPDSDESPNALR